jgi:hypothetical protein
MNEKSMGKIRLTEQELQGLELDGFYNLIGKKLVAIETDMFDCRCINIGNNIQEHWFELYKEKGADKVEVAMLLVMSGPKVDPMLAKNEVEIFEGFLTEGEME